MSLDERIRIFIDVVNDKATTGITSFRTQVSEAEGVTGKFKAGASAAFDTVKQNAAAFGMAAGTALVTFGMKAVGAFQDAALAAGKFADATGLAVDDASRWIEVAGDLGIEAGTLQSAFQKMNKSIADGKPVLSDYGVEIAKTKDGVVDVNETFINAATTIGAIEDPTKRAKAAQELFGKSYGEVAELLKMSAGDVREALNGVSDAKVIDPKELEKARKFRDTMDNLKDKLEDVALAAGEELVPRLISATEQVIALADAAAPLIRFVDGFATSIYGARYEAQQLEGQLFTLAPAIEQAGMNFDDTFLKVTSGKMTMEQLTEALKINIDITDRAANQASYYKGALVETASAADTNSTAFHGMSKEANDNADALERARRKAEELNAAYDALLGHLDQEEKWDAFNKAVWALGDGTGDAAEETRQWKKAAADLIMSLGDMPEEQKTALLLQIDQGDKSTVDQILFTLQQGVTVPVRFSGQGTVGFMKNAAGGDIRRGVPSMVGENFDGTPNSTTEMLMPDANGRVIPAPEVQSALRNILGTRLSATPYIDQTTVIINAPFGTRADDVARSQRRQRRIQGPI